VKIPTIDRDSGIHASKRAKGSSRDEYFHKSYLKIDDRKTYA